MPAFPGILTACLPQHLVSQPTRYGGVVKRQHPLGDVGVEATKNPPVPHHLARAAACLAERHARSMTRYADALAAATLAGYRPVHTIGTGDGIRRARARRPLSRGRQRYAVILAQAFGE